METKMTRNTNLIVMAMAFGGTIWAQTVVQDGTPVKLRLNETLNSGHNRIGQGVSLTVAEDVIVNERVVIEAGARAVGTVTVAEPKRRMARGGKLDFSPEKIQLADGRMVALRTSQQGSAGKGNGLATGIVAAGLAFAFLPAAPLALLIKGKDVEIPAGMTFTSFTDTKFVVKDTASGSPSAPGDPKVQSEARPTATLNITSDIEAADIEVDGNFVGQAPATFNLAPGSHRLIVHHDAQAWERTLWLSPGSSVNLKAQLQAADAQLAAKIQR
jgi:hypothetical protein